eukprot:CAMPEP_0184488920 /NCGR_PEP_ID=MMETSP0113_2-20130426/13960_1 /TAXON_ID=91329 /ORGANISM="Norrisiella sphaerica, Strain BC52" /LENGTH=325 /DNA_ID=CAMNT_0026872057 /DNA_START=26 /DNA_END=1003 /DNA_ORIENTATION=+
MALRSQPLGTVLGVRSHCGPRQVHRPIKPHVHQFPYRKGVIQYSGGIGSRCSIRFRPDVRVYVGGDDLGYSEELVTGSYDDLAPDVVREYVSALEESNSIENILNVALRTPLSVAQDVNFEKSLRRSVMCLDTLTLPKLSKQILNNEETTKALGDLNTIEGSLGNDVYASNTAKEKLHVHRIVLNAMADSILEDGGWDDYQPADLGEIAWTFAIINVQHSDLFEWMKEALYRKPNWQYTPNALAKLIFAYTVVHKDYTLLTRLLALASAPNFMGNFDKSDLLTLYDALQHVDVEEEGMDRSFMKCFLEFLPMLKARALEIEASGE